LLAGYLLTIDDGYNRVDFRATWDAHPDPTWGTVMGRSVQLDGHEANFLFRVCDREDRRLLAVTVDAEDIRQQTTEAIAKDRGLMDAGCKVLNFTDREILASPPDTAEKVSSALHDLVYEMLATAGHLNRPRPTNVSPIRRR
jgi:hypothetical protein